MKKTWTTRWRLVAAAAGLAGLLGCGIYKILFDVKIRTNHAFSGPTTKLTYYAHTLFSSKEKDMKLKLPITVWMQ